MPVPAAASSAVRAGERYPWSADFDHRVLTINISKGSAFGHFPLLAAYLNPSDTISCYLADPCTQYGLAMKFVSRHQEWASSMPAIRSMMDGMASALPRHHSQPHY